ncbi:MAG: hypothetical protein ACPG80_01810, partial [Rickettsiales bacterium]
EEKLMDNQTAANSENDLPLGIQKILARNQERHDLSDELFTLLKNVLEERMAAIIGVDINTPNVDISLQHEQASVYDGSPRYYLKAKAENPCDFDWWIKNRTKSKKLPRGKADRLAKDQRELQAIRKIRTFLLDKSSSEYVIESPVENGHFHDREGNCKCKKSVLKNTVKIRGDQCGNREIERAQIDLTPSAELVIHAGNPEGLINAVNEASPNYLPDIDFEELRGLTTGEITAEDVRGKYSPQALDGYDKRTSVFKDMATKTLQKKVHAEILLRTGSQNIDELSKLEIAISSDNHLGKWQLQLDSENSVFDSFAKRFKQDIVRESYGSDIFVNLGNETNNAPSPKCALAHYGTNSIPELI